MLQDSITNGIVEQPISQYFQEHVDVVSLMHQECMQQQTDEHIVNAVSAFR